ncbi:hypothetical protein RHCRD62_50006 [Rhodococcus sp. RD6.2]|nr:hypothetical protein RHCRD62_50006 [Rhodococcus sp. RD6.2]
MLRETRHRNASFVQFFNNFRIVDAVGQAKDDMQSCLDPHYRRSPSAKVGQVRL